MSEYKVEIEGQCNLDEINLQIAGEEAGASEFISSRVSVKHNQVTNVVTFKELDAGTVPHSLKIVKQNDPAPAGTKRLWGGVMVVSGRNTAVVAYRSI
jgi:hypothetical protein